MTPRYHYSTLLYHYVTTIVDNGLKVHIVKYFGKKQRWWHYAAIQDWDLEIQAKYDKEAKAFKQRVDKLCGGQS